MPPWSRYLGAGALALLPVGWPVLLAPVTSEGDPGVSAEVALTFADPTIDESSGLVVTADTILTVNDSGDGPYLYAVDRASGETTGVTTFGDEDPVDVEALAPGSDGTVWVGDIGDNARERETIDLYRFRPQPGDGRVEAERFSLRYPDGPQDAEALLVHPRTGRVLVVTKRPFLGGEVYAAPPDLEPGPVHRLERLASVPGMVTDGAFLPGGERVVLRTYGTAAVHAYPGFERLAAFELPEQDQGEGAAVGPDGRLYLSSEGEGSDVLVMDLPAPAAEPGESRGSPTAPSEGPTTPADRPGAGTGRGSDEPDPGTAGGAQRDMLGDLVGEAGGPWAYLAAVVLGAGALGVLAVRGSRRRSRRMR